MTRKYEMITDSNAEGRLDQGIRQKDTTDIDQRFSPPTIITLVMVLVPVSFITPVTPAHIFQSYEET